MKNQNKKLFAVASLALLIMALGCNTPATTANNEAVDITAIKAKIQEKETAFAAATTAENSEAIGTFFSDDAISMVEGKPALMGRAAIMKEFEGIKRKKGSVATYDVQDVFGSENQVTEIGKTTVKDAEGKVEYEGKYMAVWEKRNGDYVCIRDISNGDAPSKAESLKTP